ncbi:MAG: class II fructose-bisphosphate aldolase, partial [Oscillospiraceae bacterium]|nr:class II fructose-bisphosphate aldolase [Oscillospiraceae bacterium]
FAANSTYTNPMDAVKFFRQTGVDALAISYGTKHGANKGKDTVIRKEIAIATKECMMHEGIEGTLVSHGSSTVPQYIVSEINALGGDIHDAYGIKKEQLKEVSKLGIRKINVDTDIRLAVTRNLRELFRDCAALRESASIGGIYKLLLENPSAFDPRVFLPPIMDTVMYGNVPDGDVARIVDCIERGVKEVVGTLVVEFDSVGKAPLIESVSLDEMAERYRKKGI